MKKVKYVAMGMLFLGMMTLTSCKKENKLWKGSGEWVIESWNTKDETEGSPEKKIEDNCKNCGLFKFNKDGTGSIEVIEDGIRYKNLFEYSVIDNQLNITYGYGDYFISAEFFQYDIELKNKKMRLYRYDKWESISISGPSGFYEEIFELKKNKK